jgi:hypothetical protein
VPAADAVVSDRQVQAVVVCLDGEVGQGGVGVFGGVGERLGDHVVGGDLDRLR